MQSLLIALIVIVAILILVTLLLPDRLERRAIRNQQRREQLIADLTAAKAETAALQESLAPYAAMRSAAYRSKVEAMNGQVAQLQAEQLATAEQIRALRLPEIPRLPLPIQHFIVVPTDATAVFNDSSRLNKMARTVENARSSVREVEASLHELDQIPTELREETRALMRRLDAIMAALRVEQRAGIEELEDLDHIIGSQRELAAGLEPRFHNRTPLPELDASALQLEQATAVAADMEARVAELNRTRLQLDRRIQETVTELDDVQVAIKGGSNPTPVSKAMRAMLVQSAALLNESAPEARRVHDFATADGFVTAAHQLNGFGRNLHESERLLGYLESHDLGLGYGPDIAAARRELAGIMLRLSPAISSPASMSAFAASDELMDLSIRAADLYHELGGLAQNQRAAIAQLERDAVADRDRVVASWEESQRLLPLSAEDPLVGRYQRVLTQFTAARGDPAALQLARRDAATFLASQREWSDRLATQRSWQTEFRVELPRLVDQAIAAAQGWTCLQFSVKAIQQRVADFSQLQAQFNKARTSAEGLAIMDQFERLESDIRRDYSLLADQAARLNWLEDDLARTLALVALGDDEAQSPRRAKSQQMIDHRVSQAHAATRCDDAVQAMQWAAELAQNLST